MRQRASVPKADSSKPTDQQSTPSRAGSSLDFIIRIVAAMILLSTTIWLLLGGILDPAKAAKKQAVLGPNHKKYQQACPNYRHYSIILHGPLSEGELSLPYQRPSEQCRTFSSPLVEQIIEDVTSRMVDKDLARLFENAFPNTLDTTVAWHTDGSGSKKKKHHSWEDAPSWEGPQSFIITGDINAEWLRDSAGQLAQYQPLAKKDPAIFSLLLGAINTQAEFVIESPYCNAFQPPPPSHIPPTSNGFGDTVHPAYEPSKVFECKWEVDSLANFLALCNKFHKNTGSTDFLHKRWYKALESLLAVIEAQSQPTFDTETGRFHRNEYIFQRRTSSGTETMGLNGVGNPMANGTGLIRSAFRPSDDVTILPFLIPSNAFLVVELKRTAQILKSVKGKKSLAKELLSRAQTIEDGIWKYGVTNHSLYGEVFAFEVDGYGSHIIMDDANIPSLLSLPLLGFCSPTNKIYQNTRRMILSKTGNPYYLNGRSFSGIGGPHVGFLHAWPMSRLVQAMTSDDDAEIEAVLTDVKKVSRLGLIHESVNVERGTDFTRSWFAWANSIFAQTVLDLARRKPHLVFGEGGEAYTIG